MALHYSLYDMSDDEGDHQRGISYEDDEPQAIEEIVEGEVEPFNDGEDATGGDDLEDLFGDSTAPATDAEKKEAKEKKVRKKSNIPRMNSERLKGPGGIIVIDELFRDFKMQGRGHEAEDLEQILTLMQTWTHRMYPRFAFPDCIEQIERLGHNKSIKNFMLRNRNEPIMPEVTPVHLLDDDDEAAAADPAAMRLDDVDDPAPVRRGDDDAPPDSPPESPPPALAADLLERMRLNREAALKRRMDKMREREANEATANDGSLLVNEAVTVGVSLPINVAVTNDCTLPVNGAMANASVAVNDIALPFNDMETGEVSVPFKGALAPAGSFLNTMCENSSEPETPMDVDRSLSSQAVDESDRPLSR